jgi:hypothetical protein
VNLIELFEGDLEGGLVFAGGSVKIFAEAIGGVVEEHLGVLEALAVAGEIHVDQLRVVVDLLKSVTGLVNVAVQHLLSSNLGHGVDELGVEEALVAGAGLLGSNFELGQGLGVGKIAVDRGGGRERAWSESEGQREKNGSETKSKFHNAPQRERLLLHVFEGDEAVAGLPLLVRKLAVCHGEELFVQVGRLFGVVQFVVSRCRKEQRAR